MVAQERDCAIERDHPVDGVEVELIFVVECRLVIVRVEQCIDLDAQIARADLVITAEGAVDFQTPRGKIPAEVGRRAKLAGKPVIALAGSIGRGSEAVHAAGIDAVMGIIPVPMDLPEAVSRADELVTDATERALRLILLGAAIAA